MRRALAGSSLVESLLGESNEVLELQELFNFFVQSPHGHVCLFLGLLKGLSVCEWQPPNTHMHTHPERLR